MARSRNIKPAFFLNDDLAEKNCALGRLLFIGLWTLADYRGNLEWRSGKVKAQVLPYDNCDINKIAINLDKSGFIRFYSDGDRVFINIMNFTKHQNPHKNEKQAGSDIPEYSESMRQVVDLSTLTINRDLSRQEPEQDGTNPADSLLLIPDSLKPDPSNANRVNGDSKESPEKNKAFSKPDYDQVDKYMMEINNGSREDAESFVDYYTANGWKISGKAPMKDWKAAVRNWLKNKKKFGPANRNITTVDDFKQQVAGVVERTIHLIEDYPE